MTWLRKAKEGLKAQQRRRELPDGLWTKCEDCGEILYHKELERNLWTCSKCSYHFRISAQKVYEIRNGQIGQLYRGGGMTADTKDYLMKVDAVGRDFRLFPIPNCGKGQPMQTKRLGNGAPTMRSRARLTGL